MQIHLTAICGSAMANLAVLLSKLGHRVQGSDKGAYPPMSTFLRDHDIPVFEGYDSDHLDDADVVIVGNAVSRGNPEAEAVLERGHSFTSFPEALHRFVLADRRRLVVAGTHGKTTTTSLLSWTLDMADLDPGFLVGGLPRNFGVGARLGTGDFVVVEGDEYDSAFFDKVPKFLHYWPRDLIVTNVEFDHGDIYRDLYEVQWAFRRLFRLLPASGRIVACVDSPHLREILQHTYCPVDTYGLSDRAAWQVTRVRNSASGVQFAVDLPTEFQAPEDGEQVQLHLGLTGTHNALNATSVLALCLRLGVPMNTIRTAFDSFEGVARRQDVVGSLSGAPVIDDYAHHPTAVKCTLDALLERYPRKKLIVAFEFRSNTSLSDAFASRYPQAFEPAAQVRFGPLLKERHDDVSSRDGLSLQELVENMRDRGQEVEAFGSISELAAQLARDAGDDSVIAVLSSGNFGGLLERLPLDVSGPTT